MRINKNDCIWDRWSRICAELKPYVKSLETIRLTADKDKLYKAEMRKRTRE